MFEIIVAVVLFNKKVLILKRKADKRYDPNKWEFVSGFVKEKNLAVFAEKQVAFETGLKVKLVRAGKQFEVHDEYGAWLIHPFVFEAENERVKLSSDHVEYRWINADQILNYDCVKDLEKNLEMLGIEIK